MKTQVIVYKLLMLLSIFYLIECGGDTNGDGTQSLPADNDWIGIYDNAGATPYPYDCTWNNILYDSY